MKVSFIFSICLFAVVAFNVVHAQKPPLPNISNVDNLLENPEAVKEVTDCILDKGLCDSVSNQYKAWVRYVFQVCDECSEEERTNFDNVRYGLLAKYPAIYRELSQKYRQ